MLVSGIWQSDPDMYTYICKYMHMHMCCAVLSRLVMSDSLQPHGLQPAGLLSPRGFSRQEYLSGLPYPPRGDLSDPGIQLGSPALLADSVPAENACVG